MTGEDVIAHFVNDDETVLLLPEGRLHDAVLDVRPVDVTIIEDIPSKTNCIAEEVTTLFGFSKKRMAVTGRAESLDGWEEFFDELGHATYRADEYTLITDRG